MQNHRSPKSRSIRHEASSGRWRRAALLTVLALAVGTPNLVVPEVASADVRTEARRHFRRGMELIQEGQLDAGIEELQVAFDTLPHPNVLYNIGRAYAEAGRYDEALEYFEQYLASDPPDREEVQGFVSAIEARIAEAQVVETEGAETEGTEETAETEVATGPAVAVTEEEIQAIEDSATQIETLAEATQSDALRQRADRLRQLAVSLREQAANQGNQVASTAGSGTTGTGSGSSGSAGSGSTSETSGAGAGATGGTTPEGESLELGGERTGVFEEEVVSASRFAESPIDAPNSTTIITAQDIRLSGLTSLPEILRKAAGVEVMRHSPAHTDVSIRGLNTRQSNKLLILIDGRVTRFDFLGASFWWALPFALEDVERIEIIRGPASALYGADAFSGIINIIMKQPGDGDSFVHAGIGSDEQGRAMTSIHGRSDRLSYRITAGYEQANNFVQFETRERVDTAPTYNPTRGQSRVLFNGEIRYTLADGLVLRAGTGVMNGDARLQGIARLREVVGEDLFHAQTYAQLNTPVGIQLRTWWNHLDTNIGFTGQPPGGIDPSGEVRTDVFDIEASFAKQFHFLVDHNLSLGFNYRFKNVDFSWFAEGEENQTEHHIGAYLQDSMTLHERVRLTLSLRVDRHPLLSNVQVSPRGSFVVRIAEGQSVRLTGGTSFRSPSFTESYIGFENPTPLRGITALAAGNTELDPERILSFEVGYNNQASDYFALEANFFYNIIQDQIFLATIDALTLSEFGSGADGYREDIQAFPLGSLAFDNELLDFRQLGGEIGVRVFPVDGLDIYANYSILDTDPTNGEQVRGIPAVEARLDDQRTSLHKVNIGAQYRSPIGLDLSFDFHWVDDQVWTEQVTDAETIVRFDRFPIDSYILLNARLGWRLFDDVLDLGIVGYNLIGESIRQHPFAQPLDRRVMGTAKVTF